VLLLQVIVSRRFGQGTREVSLGRLLKMIPKHLKTATVVHLVLAVGLLTSVAVVTYSTVRAGILSSDNATLDMGLQQQQQTTSTQNCSTQESELEALKNNVSSGKALIDDQLFRGDEDADQPDGVIRGYVLSGTEDERFNSSKKVLDALQIQVHRAIPIPYQSEELETALNSFLGFGGPHKQREKKAFSNRMTFLNLFQTFVDDASEKLDSWHFFFENDIALHPRVTPKMAHDAIVDGMELAAADGILYLGMCRPRACARNAHLKNGLKASRCLGVCTHAFGFTKWKAAEFLSIVHKIEFPSNETGLHLDLVLRAYASRVHKIWLLGSNLQSPVENVKGHFGLLYQDQEKFPSIIESRRSPQRGGA
jgi:hypothetical protein